MAKKIPSLTGIFAALPTPLGDDGAPDISAMDPIIEFLLDSGIRGFCVGGATGEYAAYSIEQREQILRGVIERVQGSAPVVAGAGAENAGQVWRFAQAAAMRGAEAVLLPPPAFFPFDADTLGEIIANVTSKLPLPVLVYHIPQFTNDLGLDTILALIESSPNVVGLKDSSGNPENPSRIGRAKAQVPMIYLNGDDSLIVDAYQHGADGAISGIASVCPEWAVVLDRSCRSGDSRRAVELQRLGNELIAQLDTLPVPWGIHLALEVRGFHMESLAWPVVSRLERPVAAFREWFPGWLEKCLKA
ncbi:MAG TPA: dihydrodipicolinate synthase family protein [Terriglobia bacterium]|nr:dihydrodipicolinate synthase family protein [Terriglobia bacterium]